MDKNILTTIPWAKRLAKLFTVEICGKTQFFSRNRCNTVTVTFASIIVFAFVPQCGSTQTPSIEPTQTLKSESTQRLHSEPEATVRELLNAMQANNAQRIRSLFDSNASQAYGDGPTKSGAAFFRWLDSDIIQRQGRVENAQLTVNGNEVVVTGQYQSRGYTSEANFLMTVEDGLITSWRIRY